MISQERDFEISFELRSVCCSFCFSLPPPSESTHLAPSEEFLGIAAPTIPSRVLRLGPHPMLGCVLSGFDHDLLRTCALRLVWFQELASEGK